MRGFLRHARNVLIMAGWHSAVKYQMQLHQGDIKPGDVFMTNSPYAGGSYVSPPQQLTPKSNAFP